MPYESLTIRPEPRAWQAILRRNPSSEAAQIRRELKLPLDRPIIMSGHHPGFWHPGILSKYLAADAASESLSAHPVWLLVDQDRAETVDLQYPARHDGTLTIGTAAVRERTLSPIKDAHELVQPGIDLIWSVFARHSTSSTLTLQLAATISDLVQPYISVPHSNLFATDLSRTTLFRSLVEKMARDPESCITTYNAAAARHPTSGIRPLTASDIQDRWELPLWHLPPNAPRRHVFAEDLAGIPIHELAPKALLMTGLMRLAACDLFIHGLGAAASTTDDPSHEGYDIITEEWFNTWLGERLAPMALVSATRFLRLTDTPPPTAAQVAAARWRTHHARHDPMLLRDPDAALAKQRCLDQIDLLPRRSRARADAFRQLHAILDQARRAHAETLAGLNREAQSAAQRYSERAVLFNRAWPFPLFPKATLTSLQAEIEGSFQV